MARDTFFSLLPLKARQQEASIISICECKIDSLVFNSEVDNVGYDVVRLDRSRRGGEVACYIKKPLSYNHRSSLCTNIENIFIDIFLP